MSGTLCETLVHFTLLMATYVAQQHKRELTL